MEPESRSQAEKIPMETDVRRRAACDRCNSQKLKCPRQPGAERCERCVKAKAVCYFSPFRQKKKEPEGGHYDEFIAASSSSVSRVDVDHPMTSTEDTGTAVNPGKRKRTSTDPQDISLDLEGIPDASATSPGLDEPPPFEWMNNISLPAVSPKATPDPMLGSWDFGAQSPYPLFDFSAIPFLNQQCPTPKMDLVHQPSAPTSLSSPRTYDSTEILSSQDPTSWATSPPVFPQWEGDVQEKDVDPATLVRQLSDLSIRAYEHGRTVPPLSIHDHLDLAEFGPNCSDGPEDESDSKQFRPEDTFRLSQDLVDIYQGFMSSSLRSVTPQRAPQVCTSDITLNSQSSAITGTPIDHSTVLLLLSCHLRLLDIYDDLFLHMRMCITKRRQSFAATIRYGPYVVATPQPVTVPVQMLQLIQLAAQLASLVAELIGILEEKHRERNRNLGEASQGGNIDGLASSLVTAKSVKGRAVDMSRQVHLLSGEMLEHGLMHEMSCVC